MGVEIVEELESGPTFRYNVAVCQDDQCSLLEIVFKQEHLLQDESPESFVCLSSPPSFPLLLGTRLCLGSQFLMSEGAFGAGPARLPLFAGEAAKERPGHW